MLADCDAPKDIDCKCCKSCTGFYTKPLQVLGCAGKQLVLTFYVTSNDLLWFDLENSASQSQLMAPFGTAKNSSNVTYATCISSTDCFHFHSNSVSDAPFILSIDNVEIPPEHNTFKELNFGYSKQTNSLDYNMCDNFVLCGKSVKPGTTKRDLLNLLTRFTDTTILGNTSTFQHEAACWWIEDLEQRTNEDLKDTALIQRYLLSLLYFSTRGDSWSNKDLWLSNSAVCDWYGISCYQSNEMKGIINKIRLVRNNLNGILPTEIGQLLGLESLDLNMNERLSGSIPKEVKYLKELKEFKCKNCMLSNTIPTEISFLTELTELDLNNCDITGQIPSELALAKNLGILNAFNNSFYGTLPDISSLVHLRELDLGENFLGGNCESIKQLSNLERLDLRVNFFDGKLPISPSNHKELKIIHLEMNKFTGVLPTDIRFLESLEELWLYDNRLSSRMPTGIGELTNLISLSLSYNDIRGHIPADMEKLKKLEYLYLHHNRLSGIAVNFQVKLKDYVTDCGGTVSDAALVTCDDCSICCNTDGSCMKMSSTYPLNWFSSAVKRYPKFAAYIPFLIILLVCILIFFICVVTSCSKLRNKLPCIPFEVRYEFQEDSVYKFLLTDDKIGWFVALSAGAVHIMVVILFIISSDFNSNRTDIEYAFTCSRHQSDCESDTAIYPMDWFIFATLIFTFLFKDMLDGIMMAYEGMTRCDIKGCFAGTIVIWLTASSAVISTIYNKSTGISSSDIIKDAAILLFLNEIDDQLLSILRRAFPSWVKNIEDKIFLANEIDSMGSSNADDRKTRIKTLSSSNVSQSSEACAKQNSALELNANEMPDTLISSDHRNLAASNGTRPPASQAKDDSSFELMSKINEINERIDTLQMEVNRLASQSLGAVDIDERKQLSRPGKKNSDIVMTKIADIQQEIISLRSEINGIMDKLEGLGFATQDKTQEERMGNFNLIDYQHSLNNVDAGA